MLNIDKTLSWFFSILLAFLLVNAATEQIILQILKAGAQSYQPYIMIISFMLFIIVILNSNRLMVDRNSLSKLVTIFSLYTLVVMPYYLTFNELKYVISGYGSIMLLYLSVISHATRPFIKQEHLILMFVSVLILTGALGILQYAMNSPIVKTYDFTTGFKIGDFLFYEVSPPRVRGFSLFYSALDFGYFLIFMLGLLFSLSKNYKYFLVVFTLIAIYCTLTRNIYVGASLAILGIVIFNTLKKFQYIIYFLPVVSLMIGLFVSGIESSESGLSSSSSLVMRREFWRNEIERLKELNILEVLLGKGLFQSGDSVSSQLFVDNTYLLIIAQFGVFGFLIFLTMYFSVIKMIIQSEKSAINIAVYGFVVAWPFLALFNIALYPLSMFIFVVVCSRRARKEIKYEC